jgi:ABC-type phosphate transport system substrate-binding protein
MRSPPAIVLALSLALSALAAAVSAAQPSDQAAYRIIVHPKNPVTTVDRRFLEDAFLKRAVRWPDDKPIRPVDLTSKSDVRSGFSKDVLNRSIAAVKAYWQQRIFSGTDIPPPEFDSDEQVVAYVLKHEGAVGYVSGAASLGGVKALSVRR